MVIMSKRIDKYNICLYCGEKIKIANWNSNRKYCNRVCQYADPEYRKKLSTGNSGKIRTKEHCKNISKSKRGNPNYKIRGKNNPSYNPKYHTKKKCSYFERMLNN